MLAAESVAFVWVMSFAFLIYALRQQAEDRQVERHTMAFVLRRAQRYRERYRGWSKVPLAAWTASDDDLFEEEDFSVGPSKFNAQPGSRSSQRQEPKMGALQTANDARKRAA